MVLYIIKAFCFFRRRDGFSQSRVERKFEFSQRIYVGPINVFASLNFAAFGRCYFRRYCLQRAENCTSCSRFPALQFWTFFGLTRFVMSINVDDEVRNDSPIKKVCQRRGTVSCRLKMCLAWSTSTCILPWLGC